MNPTEANRLARLLPALLCVALIACSSDVTGDGSTSTGAGGATSGGGQGEAGAAAGGSGGMTHVEICAAKSNEQDCVNTPQYMFTQICVWHQLELLPTKDQCEPGTMVERCLSQPNSGTGECATTADCPAEPAGNAYYYRELDDGSVELLHEMKGDPSCNWMPPPTGFTQCFMNPTDPEACICRCTP